MFFNLKNGRGLPPSSLVMALSNKPLIYMYQCAHHGKLFIRSHAKSKYGFWTNGVNFINCTLTKLQLIIHSEADAIFASKGWGRWVVASKERCCEVTNGSRAKQYCTYRPRIFYSNLWYLIFYQKKMKYVTKYISLETYRDIAPPLDPPVTFAYFRFSG